MTKLDLSDMIDAMQQPKYSEVYSVRLPSELAGRLSEEQDASGMTRTEIIRLALDRYLRDSERERQARRRHRKH